MLKPAAPELDAATKQRLAEEVERLVAMGTDRKQARQIVWLDYQDELQQYQVAPQAEVSTPAETETEAPAAHAEEMPGPEPPPPTLSPRRFWRAADEVPLTPEWLERNRAELAKVKRLVGLRSEE
ncbi:hypothetical protein KIF53_13425 [Chromobacterium subtsugae]|uniref:Uncharacterized protein n=1 Tax=Chromobacterium subtsugae TaxID=251747 RepID=A0ABS7FEW9_9NEIS|nr:MULTISPECIES: hypothetical protein [Chromobacterium]KUM03502.1 hypothetical protein Cv017_19220 [Chromobacterium subtsugae]KZE87578.1 hypothetical protein AWB61_10345 [Chromobacterium sp. F49]MBW7567051.1 hypothetical protein [Chromobacterium subtsugae]MBW8288630.1 hypothetical protein [Chromobacterium subtsugae]WSE90143.1 hypothetical protein U6115_14735 [Chromobacterium subtsugae]